MLSGIHLFLILSWRTFQVWLLFSVWMTLIVCIMLILYWCVSWSSLLLFNSNVTVAMATRVSIVVPLIIPNHNAVGSRLVNNCRSQNDVPVNNLLPIAISRVIICELTFHTLMFQLCLFFVDIIHCILRMLMFQLCLLFVDIIHCILHTLTFQLIWNNLIDIVDCQLIRLSLLYLQICVVSSRFTQFYFIYIIRPLFIYLFC